MSDERQNLSVEVTPADASPIWLHTGEPVRAEDIDTSIVERFLDGITGGLAVFLPPEASE